MCCQESGKREAARSLLSQEHVNIVSQVIDFQVKNTTFQVNVQLIRKLGYYSSALVEYFHSELAKK